MSATTATAAANPVLRGMLLVSLAMLIVPLMDAFAKLLSATIPTGQVAGARFLFQTLFMLPLMLWMLGWRSLRPQRFGWHALRGALLAVATLLFFTALKYMPIANAIAIFFVEPLILTLMSGLFLGEKVGWRRWVAVLVGFAGAMLVIRPSFGEIGWVALMPVGTAICFASYLALTRALAKGEDPISMQCYTGFFGTLVMAAAIAAGSVGGVNFLTLVWPTPAELGLMAALGLISTISHLMVVYAYRMAEAAVLAPFQYLEIISATALGLMLFGDFPDALTWLGIAIIVGSGLFVFWREQRQPRDTPSEPVSAP